MHVSHLKVFQFRQLNSFNQRIYVRNNVNRISHPNTLNLILFLDVVLIYDMSNLMYMYQLELYISEWLCKVGIYVLFLLT